MLPTHKRFSSTKGLLTPAEAGKIFLGVLGYFAVSQISIPFQPVPMTFQTFGMLMIGLLYTPREASCATLTWLSAGLFGLPVFAGYEAGPTVLLGAKGGFLAALVIVPIVMAYIRTTFNIKSFLALCMLSMVGTGLLFGGGVLWLQMLIGWEKAFMFGVKPFLVWDMLKTMGAATAVYTLHKTSLR